MYLSYQIFPKIVQKVTYDEKIKQLRTWNYWDTGQNWRRFS